MNIKILSLLFFAACINFTLSAQSVICLQNPAPMHRAEEVVSIPWSHIEKAPAVFKVVDVKTNKEIPYQIEYLGSREPQNLLIQISIPSKGEMVLKIVEGKPAKVAPKTFARYVPERKDDFAWENDKIAFRMYGKALENFPREMAYGVDVWVKRTKELVLDKRYKLGDYHVDHGDGLDYYHVGYTLGAGGAAPYVADSLVYPKNYTHWKVLDNGPLRSTFVLYYDAWNVGGQELKMSKTITLDAGSQLNKTIVKLEGNSNSVLLAVGIIKRPEPGQILLDETDGVTGYWEPQHGNDGVTGVGTVLAGEVKQSLITQKQILTIANTQLDNTFTYYNGAAWNKAGEIKNADEWFQYLKNFKIKIQSPLIIR